MGRRTRRYQTEFLACLLALGPPPYRVLEDADFKVAIAYAKEVEEYKKQVCNWWVAWHGGLDTPPRSKSQYRFCKRYMNWCKIRRRKDDG